ARDNRRGYRLFNLIHTCCGCHHRILPQGNRYFLARSASWHEGFKSLPDGVATLGKRTPPNVATHPPTSETVVAAAEKTGIVHLNRPTTEHIILKMVGQLEEGRNDITGRFGSCRETDRQNPLPQSLPASCARTSQSTASQRCSAGINAIA